MHLTVSKCQVILMVFVFTLGHGIMQAQNRRKPDKSFAVLWSVPAPAGLYQLSTGAWPGPITHVTIDRTIRLLEIDFDTQELPLAYGVDKQCDGYIGLMEKPSQLELAPPRETSLLLSTLAPNQISDPYFYPQYLGYTATLDLRAERMLCSKPEPRCGSTWPPKMIAEVSTFQLGMVRDRQ